MRTCLRELPVNHNEAEVLENSLIEDEYNRMTVNQLRQERRSKRFTALGIARMKKCQLIEFFEKNQQQQKNKTKQIKNNKYVDMFQYLISWIVQICK